jgi:hypothetical protein
MSKPLVRVDHEVVSSGLFPDMRQQSAPFWQKGQNVYFRNFKVGPFPGRRLLFRLQSQPIIVGMKSLGFEVMSEPGVVLGTKDKIYLWSDTAGVTEKGSGFTGIKDQTKSQSATRWSFEQWGTWVLATNGVDVPQIYKGTTFGALAGVNFTTAEIFLRWRTFMFAFNLNGKPTTFRWCSDDNVELWVPAGTNSAGASLVRDVDNRIMAAGFLGGNIVFFGVNSMHAINFVGTPNFFGQNRLLSGIGALGKNSICTVKGQVIGIGQRGVWKTDGTSYEYFDPPAVREYIRKRWNYSQATKTICYYDAATNHLVIHFPVLNSDDTENTEGVTCNLDTGQWAPLLFGRSASADGEMFNYGLTADRFGNIWLSDETSPFSDFEDFHLKLNPNITITAGWGECGWGELGWGGQDAYDAGVTVPIVNENVEGVNAYSVGDDESVLLETRFSDLSQFQTGDEPSRLDSDKLIDAVRLEVGDVLLTNTQLYVGTKANLKDEAVWFGPFSVSQLDQIMFCRTVEAKYIALRIRDPKPEEQWQLTAIEVFGEVTGGRR